MTSALVSGLDSVVAATTRLSHVDGERGELLIAGFPVEELAPHATLEQAAYLLWHGELPDAAALAALRTDLAVARELPPATVALLRAAAESGATPMDALRMGVASLSLATPPASPGETPRAVSSVTPAHRPAAETAALAAAVQLTGAFPALVAAHWRLRRGQEPLPNRPELSPAAAFLWLLEGEEPTPERVRALGTYLCTVVDHGLNASTFAARVVTSTGSDLVSAVTAAVGALKGPLHGGAPGPALDTVFEIGTAERAEPVLRAKLERGERLMGFGHRVYRVRDPRADVLGAAAERFYREGGDASLYSLARHVEATALRLLREKKPDRRLDTNVEFYTALLLHGLGLPTDLFTPTFAIGRVAGWTAHCLEQLREGRLIRPQAEYVGPRGRRWTAANG
ncbi:MAG TPA: citrate synthase/methylcitrate synthase [Thermoanaerobaculia bacterium]|nr:citrate synthase/methylcitrate synthase [Thermoanaerobaculia bacterium]HXT51774.1 citrate synthase/methylcitrate synthase [Thermoanaerobaculia bacterium]